MRDDDAMLGAVITFVAILAIALLVNLGYRWGKADTRDELIREQQLRQEGAQQWSDSVKHSLLSKPTNE